MGAALPIRADLTTEALRRHARGEPNRRAALRLLAIANALEGVSRAEAARLAGMERQALRDAVVRYNAEGIAGLCRGHRGAVRPAQARPPAASQRGGAGGPDGAGVPRPRSGAGRRLGLDAGRPVRLARDALRQAVPPVQPVAGAQAPRPVAAEDPARAPPGRPESPGALQKKGLRDALRAAAEAHPGKRIALWFMDEARVGQKGRLCHRWWARGRRPPGRRDRRFEWAYLFAAVEPATGADVALVLPEACRRRPRRR